MLDWLSDSEYENLIREIQTFLNKNYDFEIVKTLKRLKKDGAKNVCLQFPEGLLIWSESIAYLIEKYGYKIDNVIIIADVTYGACCIEDIKCVSLGCDFIIHYAHSCLVPVNNLLVPCLYIFVHISINHEKLANTILGVCDTNIANYLAIGDTEEINIIKNNVSQIVKLKIKIALCSTIQFSKALHSAYSILKTNENYEFYIPSCLPLSAGETLGCTSAKFDDATKLCIFISDGRFHIESAMIQNPNVKFMRFDPFINKIFTEEYNINKMLTERKKAILDASMYNKFLILTSTLGRQGCIAITETLKKKFFDFNISVYIIFINELNYVSLNRYDNFCLINIGCPRLSIDWASSSCKMPILNSFEAFKLFEIWDKTYRDDWSDYSMDYFASNGGIWSNYYQKRGRNGSVQNFFLKKSSLIEKWRQLKK